MKPLVHMHHTAAIVSIYNNYSIINFLVFLKQMYSKHLSVYSIYGHTTPFFYIFYLIS